MDKNRWRENRIPQIQAKSQNTGLRSDYDKAGQPAPAKTTETEIGTEGTDHESITMPTEPGYGHGV